MHAVWGTELDGGAVMRVDDHEFQPIPSVAELQNLDHELIRVLEAVIEAARDGFLLEALPSKIIGVRTPEANRCGPASLPTPAC